MQSSQIITDRLAACVNIVPSVTSIYSWEGKLEESAESMMIIKTKSDRLTELTAFVTANHPYDTPEVIAVPVAGGSDAYLNWVRDSVK